ncbi:hypothetical protein BCR44DRAFT_331229 [Catenaria anguillulae PL171]|uniref:Secreted protein n=1 Tax=Catenaria anguillulae PL171 TaxID=765915 RepID=A0A1Y2HL43_9FUNG|nr:hypothetical protein BCR44DRAFT_331229 [Catenaria anguillulae PL171]
MWSGQVLVYCTYLLIFRLTTELCTRWSTVPPGICLDVHKMVNKNGSVSKPASGHLRARHNNRLIQQRQHKRNKTRKRSRDRTIHAHQPHWGIHAKSITPT